MSAAVGQVATAAEVKPIAVEVVGEPNSTRSLAQRWLKKKEADSDDHQKSMSKNSKPWIWQAYR